MAEIGHYVYLVTTGISHMVPGIQVFVIIACIFILAGVFVPVSAVQAPAYQRNFTFLTEEFPPFNYLENGTPGGLAVDLLVATMKEAGHEIPATDIRIVPLNEGLSEVRNITGSVIFSIARTPSREEYYHWIGPFASYNIVLFSLRERDITIQSAGELGNYTTGVVTSDVSGEKLAQLGVNPEKIIRNPDPVELFRLLDNGTIDLVASGDLAGEYFIKKMNGTPESYKIVYRMDSTPLYFAFNRETPKDQRDQFEQALRRLSLTPAEGGLSGYDRVMTAWSPEFGLNSLKFYTEDYYPFNYPENGTLKGISITLLGEIYRRLDTNLTENQVIPGPWEVGYRNTVNTTGTVLFSTARSPEREELFLWAGPIFTDSNVIFNKVSDRSVITSPKDLDSLRIGAVTDDIAALDLIGTGHPDIFLAPDAKILIRALENGSIDGWAYARYPGKDLISRYAKNPEGIQPVYTLKSHEYYYAFNKDTPLPLVQSFQRAIDLVKEEKNPEGLSRYDQILEMYNISPPLSGSSSGTRR